MNKIWNVELFLIPNFQFPINYIVFWHKLQDGLSYIGAGMDVPGWPIWKIVKHCTIGR